MHILMVYHNLRKLNFQRLPLDIFVKFAYAFSSDLLIKFLAFLNYNYY